MMWATTPWLYTTILVIYDSSLVASDYSLVISIWPLPSCDTKMIWWMIMRWYVVIWGCDMKWNEVQWCQYLLSGRINITPPYLQEDIIWLCFVTCHMSCASYLMYQACYMTHLSCHIYHGSYILLIYLVFHA